MSSPAIAFRLPPEITDRLDVLADETGVGRSEIIREAIDALLVANPVTDIQVAELKRRRASGARRTDSLRKPTSAQIEAVRSKEPTTGIEPVTYGLRNRFPPPTPPKEDESKLDQVAA